MIRESRDPVWSQDVLGMTSVKRQYNYIFQLLQSSGTAGERSDTAEFLDDYTEWIDEMNAKRKIPMLGDEPQDERIWTTGAGFIAEWDGFPASVYTMQLHIQRTKIYEMMEE